MLRSFSHGIHPRDAKEISAGSKIKRFPFAPHLVVLLAQHAGRPARPVVFEGQEVARGDLLAEADGFVSAPIHSPASGKITSLSPALDFNGKMAPAIFLEPFPGSLQTVDVTPKSVAELSPKEILEGIQNMGMVGLGGAAFPTHVKFSPPEGKKINTLIVNACECEPYLTADDQVMREHSEDIVKGILLALKVLEAERAIIAVESNKPEAIATMRKAIEKFDEITLEVCQTKYPQGAEKMLTRALLGIDIPAGGLPADIGLMVSNVTTLSEIGMLLPRGQGLIERVITISGEGVKKPGNYLMPIGTPLSFVLDTVGLADNAGEVIFGGPMMGKGACFLETPITKGVSGIIVLTKDELGKKVEPPKIYPCIKCSECLQACPLHLNPSRLGILARKNEFEKMEESFNLFDCFECGCCSYVCPSNIPLVQYFRIAKQVQRERKAAQ